MGEFYEYHYERAAVGGYDGKAHVRADLARRLRTEQEAIWFAEEAIRSRARRAARARAEQERRESHAETRALIATAELRLAAPYTDLGGLLTTLRRHDTMRYTTSH